MSRMHYIVYEGLEMYVDDKLYRTYRENGNRFPDTDVQYTALATPDTFERFVFDEEILL